MDYPTGSGPERSPVSRRRRRLSIWTVLAPVAVIVLFVAVFSALGDSCVMKDCASQNKDKDSGEVVDKKNTQPLNARVKVQLNDTLGLIAAKYDLTQEELMACNPDADPQTLQPGKLLFVSGDKCEDADLAEKGANPDPLAGNTTTGAGASGTDVAPGGATQSEDNGTAAADPSTKIAKDPADTSAESGDEG